MAYLEVKNKSVWNAQKQNSFFNNEKKEETMRCGIYKTTSFFIFGSCLKLKLYYLYFS
jgi:hypothetical protein